MSNIFVVLTTSLLIACLEYKEKEIREISLQEISSLKEGGVREQYLWSEGSSTRALFPSCIALFHASWNASDYEALPI